MFLRLSCAITNTPVQNDSFFGFLAEPIFTLTQIFQQKRAHTFSRKKVCDSCGNYLAIDHEQTLGCCADSAECALARLGWI